MAITTENYGLKKPLEIDYYDIKIQNENMDIIDHMLKENGDKINSETLARVARDTELGNLVSNLSLEATQSSAGQMSASDKAKLDGIAPGANKTEIVDNLTSTEASKSLSAKQGKVLKDSMDTVAASINGFTGKTITFNVSGSIIESRADGGTLTTVFGDNGTIIEVLVQGGITKTKTTTFYSNGNIMEVIS